MTVLAINGGKPIRVKPFPVWPTYGVEEEAALMRVLKSRRWFSGMLGSDVGSEVAQFEEAFADYHDCSYGIAVANGTAALEVALKCVGVGVGDEVIVPALTFIGTASAVLQIGAVPVIVDVEPKYYCIEPIAVARAITERTRAVIPVHFGGQLAAMESISRIAREKSIAVVEDAAHAHGTVYRGKKAGSFGEVGCFSFQESKTMTSGEGGILITNDQEIAELARSYRSCGRNQRGAWYEHFRLGWNYRMTEFQGAILRAQLSRLEEQVLRRTGNGRLLSAQLQKVAGFEPVVDSPGMQCNGHYYFLVRTDPEYFGGARKPAIVRALNAEGIPCTEGYPFPINQNPMFQSGNWRDRTYPSTATLFGKHYNVTKVRVPEAENACRQMIVIPQELLLGTDQDMDDIVAAFAKVSSAGPSLANI